MNVYFYGERVRLSGYFTVGGVLTDPTTITLELQDPGGAESSYTYAAGEVTRESSGKYYRDVTLDRVGLWRYRWAGSGAVVSAFEDSFRVRESEFDE